MRAQLANHGDSHHSCGGRDPSQPSLASCEHAAHGLRDFSPGASAISAMRPPFSATQEFFVSGYLSV